MQKNLIIGIVVVMLIAASGGFYMLNQSKKSVDTTTATTAQSSSSDNAVIASIKDALAGTASLSCEYTDEQGRQTKSYIKNGKIRADIVAPKVEESGIVIIKDQTMYFWNVKKEGVKMTFSKEMLKDAAGQQNATQQKEFMDNLEQYKEHCKQATVSDSLFVVPTDVTFTDLSGFMNSNGNSDAYPTIDQAQLKKMMEQYSTQ